MNHFYVTVETVALYKHTHTHTLTDSLITNQSTNQPTKVKLSNMLEQDSETPAGLDESHATYGTLRVGSPSHHASDFATYSVSIDAVTHNATCTVLRWMFGSPFSKAMHV